MLCWVNQYWTGFLSCHLRLPDLKHLEGSGPAGFAAGWVPRPAQRLARSRRLNVCPVKDAFLCFELFQYFLHSHLLIIFFFISEFINSSPLFQIRLHFPPAQKSCLPHLPHLCTSPRILPQVNTLHMELIDWMNIGKSKILWEVCAGNVVCLAKLLRYSEWRKLGEIYSCLWLRSRWFNGFKKRFLTSITEIVQN